MSSNHKRLRRERVQVHGVLMVTKAWIHCYVMIISPPHLHIPNVQWRVEYSPVNFLFFFFLHGLNIYRVTALDIKRRINCVTVVHGQKSETLRVY